MMSSWFFEKNIFFFSIFNFSNNMHTLTIEKNTIRQHFLPFLYQNDYYSSKSIIAALENKQKFESFTACFSSLKFSFSFISLIA